MSDEADYVAVAGAGNSVDLEACSNHETSKEPDATSSCVANLKGLPVSMRSSSDWEAVTTPDATFLGVTLEARVAQDGVAVLGERIWGHAHHQSQ